MTELRVTRGVEPQHWWPIAPWARDRAAHRGLATLVVGGGAAAKTLIRDLRDSPDYGLDPVAVLDDDVGVRAVCGLPVLGRLRDLQRVVRENNIGAVIVAIPSLPTVTVAALVRDAAYTGASVRFLPSFLAAMERVARAADLRSVNFSELLGRPERRSLAPRVRAALTGTRVLVTGAGGSIGQELCRQIRSCDPAALVMVDHDESNLHNLQLELDGKALLESPDAVIADIRDTARIQQVFQAARPEVVFHAAAHKHLPLLEKNPCEAVKSNVLGTQNVVRAALSAGADRFLLISTDKAADPRSVLGATKRLAEMIVQANAYEGTQVCSVRFGNVLGSRGSLLTAVADQVERGDAVTVTDPDVTRFFMTVEEAVGLVLSAAFMAEYGETFVLDMGEPVRIVDLVRRYAAQLHVPDVQIEYTGLRPGEKMHETLFSEHEQRLATVVPGIWATRPSRLPENFFAQLDALQVCAAGGHDAQVRAILADLMPDYSYTDAGPHERALAAQTSYPDEF
jgi:FlaA1/EpsC-like NDP-sugar epimerase